MRLLFVNHLHPNSGLVGALRMQRFAEEMAKRGHRVLLLCACHKGTPDTPASSCSRIASHDWAQPLVLAVRDDSFTKLQLPLTTEPRPFHRAQTAAKLILGGGPFWRWQRAARAFRKPIRECFAPELAYATFGNLDALAIARDYARADRIPWVMDIKDPASAFLPKLLADWLMRRYRDASAVTLNSEFQRDHNGCWANSTSSVIYSGVEIPPAVDSGYDAKSVALVGSVYTDTAAALLLRGFSAWRKQSQASATLHYFGVDSRRISTVAARTGTTDGLVVEGQVPRKDLLARCARMTAVMYAACPERTFHHKLLELAALGRPVISSPTDGDEAKTLCVRFQIAYTGATTADVVRNSLQVASGTATAPMEQLRAQMSWRSAAVCLEDVFDKVRRRARPIRANDE